MTVRLNVDISEELNSRLDALASQSGTTKSELMGKALALSDLAVLREIVGI